MVSKREFKSNNNITYSCKYHVVWCTKYRRKVLSSEIQARLKTIILDISEELECEVIELEIMADHVHVLCEVDPQFGIHRYTKRVKGTSSRLLRQEFKTLRTRLPTLWTNSYFVATIGGAPRSVIKSYIENQKKS